jgi:CBS domain-containing protein
MTKALLKGSITRGIRVKDCMVPGVATIHSDALARGAAELMRTRKIRHLPVVDRGGRLVGIVTDRDLRQVIFDPSMRERLGSAASGLGDVTVRDVMTWGVVTIRPGADIREAARRMHEQRIGALPVVEGERVVGMLTEHDVLAAFRRMLGERPELLHAPPVLGPRAKPTRVRPLPAEPERGPAQGDGAAKDTWNAWWDVGPGD